MCKPPTLSSQEDDFLALDAATLRRGIVAVKSGSAAREACSYTKFSRARSDGNVLLLSTTIEEEEGEGDDAAASSHDALTQASPPRSEQGQERSISLAASAVASVASGCSKLLHRLLHHDQRQHGDGRQAASAALPSAPSPNPVASAASMASAHRCSPFTATSRCHAASEAPMLSSSRHRTPSSCYRSSSARSIPLTQHSALASSPSASRTTSQSSYGGSGSVGTSCSQSHGLPVQRTYSDPTPRPHPHSHVSRQSSHLGRRLAPPPSQQQQQQQPHLVASLDGDDVYLSTQALQLAAQLHEQLWGPDSGAGVIFACGLGRIAHSSGHGRRRACMQAAGPLYEEALANARAIRHRALQSLVKEAVARYANPIRGAPEEVLDVIEELLTGCGGVAAAAVTAAAAAAARPHGGRAAGGGIVAVSRLAHPRAAAATGRLSESSNSSGSVGSPGSSGSGALALINARRTSSGSGYFGAPDPSGGSGGRGSTGSGSGVASGKGGGGSASRLFKVLGVRS